MDERGEDEALVIVGRYLEPTRAQMAKGLLASAGIEGFLQGENANALLPLAFRARLLVRAADVRDARELLAGDAGDGPGETGEVSEDGD